MPSSYPEILCSVCGKPISIYSHKWRAKGYCSQLCAISMEGLTTKYLQAKEAKLEKIKLEMSATTAWRPAPLDVTINIVTPNPVLVIGDIHCPLVDERWAYKAVETALHFECKHVVVNGDLVDANQISKYLGGEYRRKSEFNDDIESASKFIEILCDEFDSVSYTLGNHTQRMLRNFMGEVALTNLMKMIYTNEKFRATEKHFLDINGKVRCLHPRAYSRIRGKLTQDLAQRYQMHMLTSHHHHSASSVSADAKFQAVEIGCLAKIDLFSYAQYAMHGMPEMLNGFGIVLPESEDHRILNFNEFSPWKRFGLSPL